MDGDANFVAKGLASVGSPANCLSLAGSLLDRTSTGIPSGGGNWFIEAPSYDRSDTYYWFGGWAFDDDASWIQCGAVWPRHNEMANTAFVDGHAKALTIDAIAGGVDPRTYVGRDWDLYIWDRG